MDYKLYFLIVFAVFTPGLQMGCTNGTLNTSGFGGYYNSYFTFVLGQATSNSSFIGAGNSGMSGPKYVATDGTHFAVSDTGNNRVLLWNEMPMSMDQPADLVIGQLNFTNTAPNQGGISAGTLSAPTGVAFYGGQFLVADSGNARVLIWPSIPFFSGQNATFVIGQNTFLTSGPGITQTTFSNNLGSIAVDTSGLYLADGGNSRVLYWSSIPAANFVPAGFVVGQGTFLASSGTATQSGLNTPMGVASNGTFLAIADSSNSRVMIYSLPLSGNGPNAMAVLGEINYTGNSSGCSATAMALPQGVAFRGNSLYIADTAAPNSRVLYWANITTITQFAQPADAVFGQPNMTTCGSSTSQTTVSSPYGIFSDSLGNLWISDHGNNRVTVNPWF